MAHLSDLHVHRRVGPAHRAAGRLLAAMRPDVLVITGDFADAGSRRRALEEYAGRLAQLAPAFAVLGNHDHESPRRARWVVEALDAAGVRVLDNRRAQVRAGPLEVELVGVDSPDIGRDDLEQALSRPPVVFLNVLPVPGRLPSAAGRQPSTVRVTLAHSYHVLQHASPERCGALVLAGDTHGGQVVLPVLGPVWATRVHRHRYVAGLYRIGPTWLYVNRGLGTIGPPVRFGCPPEVTVIDLHLDDPP